MYFDDDEPLSAHSAANEGSTLGSQMLYSPPSGSKASGSATADLTSSTTLELIYAVENERHCPTILPYPTQLISRITAMLLRQSKRIEQLEAEELEATQQSTGVSLLPFQRSDILRVETLRVKFFLSELLRVRVHKIEALAPSIAYEKLSQDNESSGFPALTPPTTSANASKNIRSALSPNELLLAEQLAVLRQESLQRTALHLLPAPLQLLTPNLPHGEGDEILPVPDVNAYVFLLALEDLGSVALDADVSQDIHADEVFLAPYRVVAPYVVEGRARLA